MRVAATDEKQTAVVTADCHFALSAPYKAANGPRT